VPNSGPIPIRNVYYLFLYAWRRFDEGKAIEIGATEAPDAVGLFAKVLANGVRRLLRRGIDRGYLEFVEETQSPRGRILIGETVKMITVSRGRVVARHDELDVDVAQNRVLKATLTALSQVTTLDVDLALELRTLARALRGVAEVPLTRDLFRYVHLSKNNRHYDLLIRVCALVLENLLPEEKGTGHKFADVITSWKQMPMVFEAFIRNFYDLEQQQFKVIRQHLSWDAQCLEPWHERHLPTMQTDISLQSPERTIVVDTKFYQQTLLSNWGGTEKVQSSHLYQLLTYLHHTCSGPKHLEKPEGILIYPLVGDKDIKLDYRIGEHRVAVRTILLNQEWTNIHTHLLEILEPISTKMFVLGPTRQPAS
jgi:5-methylcytosine-specific restriction enzyme subunit McrC